MTQTVICHSDTNAEFRAAILARSGHALRPPATFVVDGLEENMADYLKQHQKIVLVDQNVPAAWSEFSRANLGGSRAPLALHVGPTFLWSTLDAAAYLYLWPARCNGDDWRRATAAGGTLVNLEDFFASGLGLLEFTQAALGDLLLRSRPTFLSLDLAAFSAPFGIRPAEFWPVLTTLLHRLDVRVFGLSSASIDLAVEFTNIFLHAQKKYVASL